METNNSNIFKFILIVVFIVLVILGGVLIFKNNNKNQEKAVSTENISPTVIPITKRGFMNISEEISDIKIKNQVDLKLSVDSDGENVTAFDVLIAYDPTKVEYVTVNSLNPDFKAYTKDKEGNISLTVVKTNLNNVTSIFKGDDIIRLIFKPKTTGEIGFKILPSLGKETTKYVNEKTQIIYPNINEVSVSVN